MAGREARRAAAQAVLAVGAHVASGQSPGLAAAVRAAAVPAAAVRPTAVRPAAVRRRSRSTGHRSTRRSTAPGELRPPPQFPAAELPAGVPPAAGADPPAAAAGRPSRPRDGRSTNKGARFVTRKVIDASQAKGARESGPDAADLEPGALLRHRRDGDGGARQHGVLRRIGARPARPRPALPAGHDGAVRGRRAGHRPGPRPGAARPPAGPWPARRSDGRCWPSSWPGTRPTCSSSIRARSARSSSPRPTGSCGRRRHRGWSPRA